MKNKREVGREAVSKFRRVERDFLNFGQDSRSAGNNIHNHFDRVVVVFLGLDLERRLLLLQIRGGAKGTSAGCSTAATGSDGLVWLRKVLIRVC